MKIVGVGLLVIVCFMMSARGQSAPSVNQIDRRAMQQVCESSATIDIDPRGHFQCSVCPSFTDFHGTRQSLDLQAVYPGHFSTTNTDQLLLALYGCESHASGSGGSILLTRDGTAWKKSGYFKGDNASRCLSFKVRNDLDYLVCSAGDSHFGNSVYWIRAQSYKDNSLYTEPLLETSGNMGIGSPVAHYCYDQSIGTLKKLPSGNGLSVAVTQTRGLAPPGENSCGEAETPMEPTQTVNLNFQFDSEHFAVAPESKAGMQKVKDFLPHQ